MSSMVGQVWEFHFFDGHAEAFLVIGAGIEPIRRSTCHVVSLESLQEVRNVMVQESPAGHGWRRIA